MRTELKKQIILWIFNNVNEFQIVNQCKQAFREYIYNSKGEYLIGGEDVSEFINCQINLITK